MNGKQIAAGAAIVIALSVFNNAYASFQPKLPVVPVQYHAAEDEESSPEDTGKTGKTRVHPPHHHGHHIRWR